MASHDFQTGLQNYLDLADLRKKISTWETNFEAYDDMVAIRHEHYEPLLPDVDAEFRELDSRMRLRVEQHRMLVKRRDALLTAPHPEFLATPAEHAVMERLDAIEIGRTDEDDVFTASTIRRIERLKGLVRYTLETEYHTRLTEFDRNLRDLDESMAIAQAQYDQYVRARQAATHSFDGYEQPMNRLQSDALQAAAQIDLLMERQGRLLEVVAIDELMARRSRLEIYSDKARFALADSYDRATRTQAKVEE